MNELLLNIDKLHTTTLGEKRIKRNLKLESNDVISFLKEKILNKNTSIYRIGKNYYCEIDNIIITINAYSYTIITTHIVKIIKNN